MGARVLAGRRYSWDDAKRKKVKKDHGVDLATLPEAFDQPTVEMEAQPDERDGWRYKMLGLTERIVVVVVYAENADATEIRLITARWANKIEQSLYYREVFGEGY
jgi:uncharacterized DUF497 family protein